MRKISQREARRLQQRVASLENTLDNQRSAWSNSWPGGIHISTETVTVSGWSAIHTARRLEHAVVAVDVGDNKIMLYALPLPKKENA